MEWMVGAALVLLSLSFALGSAERFLRAWAKVRDRKATHRRRHF